MITVQNQEEGREAIGSEELPYKVIEFHRLINSTCNVGSRPICAPFPNDDCGFDTVLYRDPVVSNVVISVRVTAARWDFHNTCRSHTRRFILHGRNRRRVCTCVKRIDDLQLEPQTLFRVSCRPSDLIRSSRRFVAAADDALQGATSPIL